jgi:hypothetical protein
MERPQMVALLLIPLALAGRVERFTEQAAKGERAEVIEAIDKLEKAGSLGDDAAALLALRDRLALDTALATESIAALTTYRQTYPKSTLLNEALEKEWAWAYADAQAEASSAAMRHFVETYPNSPFREQALSMEAGFAYQEAVQAGTPEAISAFLKAHPKSPYAANAWESIAARTPGIYLRLDTGLPATLTGIPLMAGSFAFPADAPTVPPKPIVAVNMPGTGRGETSQWWRLTAVNELGQIDAVAPVARLWEQSVSASPPFLLDLVALPGTHAARVAAPAEPLVLPGACTGKARFAFLLTQEQQVTAFPFTVDCAAVPAEDSASSLLFTAFGVAESGDPDAAGRLWDQAKGVGAGGHLLEWLGTLSTDAKKTFVTDRPTIADVLVYDGTATTWWHATAGGPVAIGKKDGLWIADGGRLWAWEPRMEPWTAAAGGGCKAGSGERAAATLVDHVGGERVDVAFAGATRGGKLTPRQYAGGAIAVIEESTNDGCGRADAPLPRTVRLPGARVAALPPDWAATLIAGAPGHSVVTESPWPLYAAFSK